MVYDLIVKGGNVVLRSGVQKADLAVIDGQIALIAPTIEAAAATILDATGQYVMPGMVDTHVHISEPGRTEWEGFTTGTKALAAGGTTCYVEMPLNALPATTNRQALQLKLDAARSQNYVDYAFYGGLIQNNLDDLHGLAAGGVLAYKCFISSCGSDIPGDFENVDDYALYKGMQRLAELDYLLCIHAENASITDSLALEKIAQGKISAQDYLDSRPIFAEVEAVQRSLLFAKETGCKIHFVHISSHEAVDVISEARASGLDVTVESCPHYFAFTAEAVAEIGVEAKCSPPIRKAVDQERLWQDLLDGRIDWLTSDHSPCTPDLKTGSMFEAWGGISGCQNNVDVMFDLAVKQRHMPVHQFVDLIATNPATRFGIENKGELTVGKDADIILLDPNASYILQTKDLYYKNKHSVYVGANIGCRVTKTILRGQIIYDHNQGILGEPKGRLIAKPQANCE